MSHQVQLSGSAVHLVVVAVHAVARSCPSLLFSAQYRTSGSCNRPGSRRAHSSGRRPPRCRCRARCSGMKERREHCRACKCSCSARNRRTRRATWWSATVNAKKQAYAKHEGCRQIAGHEILTLGRGLLAEQHQNVSVFVLRLQMAKVVVIEEKHVLLARDIARHVLDPLQLRVTKATHSNGRLVFGIQKRLGSALDEQAVLGILRTLHNAVLLLKLLVHSRIRGSNNDLRLYSTASLPYLLVIRIAVHHPKQHEQFHFTIDAVFITPHCNHSHV